MSSRPLIKPSSVITDGDMSADIFSLPTIISNTTMIAYQVTWEGTAPVGLMSVQVSNDYSQNEAGGAKNPGNWTDLMLSSTPAVAGNTGSGIINLTDLSVYAIRVKYTRTSGVGVMQATLVGKVQ